MLINMYSGIIAHWSYIAYVAIKSNANYRCKFHFRLCDTNLYGKKHSTIYQLLWFAINKQYKFYV